MTEKKEEREYYNPVKGKLEDLFRTRCDDFYLEITADKKFSNKIKAEVRQGREIIFLFLKEASPDITGFVKGKYSSDFIVAEVKKEKIILDDVYQATKYRDLFDSKYTFLVSLEPIPEEIKRLHKAVSTLLHHPSIYHTFTLVHFDEKTNEFVEWYPENPFDKDLYWR